MFCTLLSYRVYSLWTGECQVFRFFSPRNPILKSHEFFGRRHHLTVSSVNFNRFTKCTIGYEYIIRKLWQTTRSFFTIPVFIYFSQILRLGFSENTLSIVSNPLEWCSLLGKHRRVFVVVSRSFFTLLTLCFGRGLGCWRYLFIWVWKRSWLLGVSFFKICDRACLSFIWLGERKSSQFLGFSKRERQNDFAS